MKKYIAIGAAFVIAIGSYFAFDVPLDDAVKIAFDKDKAVEACTNILNGE